MNRPAGIRTLPGDPGARLLAQVGQRVRRARDMAGFSRRVLSERSGVSPRYLAQLEAGEGNISIALLARVAGALDRPVAWFVGDDEAAFDSDLSEMARLLAMAPHSLREEIRARLGARPATRDGRICLIGLRGAGKSTLGRLAGEALGMTFIELNREIEALAAMPVAEIQALYGPDGYRRLEAEAIEEIIARPGPLILAVAGGLVAEPATYERVLGAFHTIWLRASAQEHMDRVRAQGDTRPMAGHPAAMERLRTILADREHLHAQAEATYDTSGETVETSTAALVQLICERGFVGPEAPDQS